MSLYEATFTWSQAANSVIVTGDFDHWKKTIHLIRIGDIFTATVKVPYNATVHYKFIVDGEWRLRTDLPTARVWESGIVNNIIHTPPEPPRPPTPIPELAIETVSEAEVPTTSDATEPVANTESSDTPEASAADVAIPGAPAISTVPADVGPNVEEVEPKSNQVGPTIPEPSNDNITKQIDQDSSSYPATVVGAVETSVNGLAPSDSVLEPGQPISDPVESVARKPEAPVEDPINATHGFTTEGPELATPVPPTVMLEEPAVQAEQEFIAEPSKALELTPSPYKVEGSGPSGAEANDVLHDIPVDVHEDGTALERAPVPASLDSINVAPVPTVGDAVGTASEVGPTDEVPQDVAASTPEGIVSKAPAVPDAASPNGNRASMFDYVASNVGLAIKSFTGIDLINSENLPDSEFKGEAVRAIDVTSDKEFEEKIPELVLVPEPEDPEPVHVEPVLIPSDITAIAVPVKGSEVLEPPAAFETVPTPSVEDLGPTEALAGVKSRESEIPVPAPVALSETDLPAFGESIAPEAATDDVNIPPAVETAVEKSAVLLPATEDVIVIPSLEAATTETPINVESPKAEILAPVPSVSAVLLGTEPLPPADPIVAEPVAEDVIVAPTIGPGTEKSAVILPPTEDAIVTPPVGHVAIETPADATTPEPEVAAPEPAVPAAPEEVELPPSAEPIVAKAVAEGAVPAIESETTAAVTPPEPPIAAPTVSAALPETESSLPAESIAPEAVAKDEIVIPTMDPSTEKSGVIPPSAEDAIVAPPLESVATETPTDVTLPDTDTAAPVPAVLTAPEETQASPSADHVVTEAVAEDVIVPPAIESLSTGPAIGVTSSESETPAPAPAVSAPLPEAEPSASVEPIAAEVVVEDEIVAPTIDPSTEKSAAILPSAEDAIVATPLEPVATETPTDVTLPEPDIAAPAPAVLAVPEEREISSSTDYVEDTIAPPAIEASSTEAAPDVTSPESEAPVPALTVPAPPPETEPSASTEPTIAEAVAEGEIVAPTIDPSTEKSSEILLSAEDAIAASSREPVATETPDVTSPEPEVTAPESAVLAAPEQTEALSSAHPIVADAIAESVFAAPAIESVVTETPTHITSPAEPEIVAPVPPAPAALSETVLLSADPVLTEAVAKDVVVPQTIDPSAEKPAVTHPFGEDAIAAPPLEPIATEAPADVTLSESEIAVPVFVAPAAAQEPEGPSSADPVKAVAEDAIVAPAIESVATTTPADVTSPEPEIVAPVPTALSETELPSADPILAEALAKDVIVAPTTDPSTEKSAVIPQSVEDANVAPTEAPADATLPESEIAAPVPGPPAAAQEPEEPSSADLVKDAIVTPAIESVAPETATVVTSPGPDSATPAPPVLAALSETELPSAEPIVAEGAADVVATIDPRAMILPSAEVPIATLQVEAAVTEAPTEVTSLESETPAPAPAVSAAPLKIESPPPAEPIVTETVTKDGVIPTIDPTTEKSVTVLPSAEEPIVAPPPEAAEAPIEATFPESETPVPTPVVSAAPPEIDSLPPSESLVADAVTEDAIVPPPLEAAEAEAPVEATSPEAEIPVPVPVLPSAPLEVESSLSAEPTVAKAVTEDVIAVPTIEPTERSSVVLPSTKEPITIPPLEAAVTEAPTEVASRKPEIAEPELVLSAAPLEVESPPSPEPIVSEAVTKDGIAVPTIDPITEQSTTILPSTEEPIGAPPPEAAATGALTEATSPEPETHVPTLAVSAAPLEMGSPPPAEPIVAEPVTEGAIGAPTIDPIERSAVVFPSTEAIVAPPLEAPASLLTPPETEPAASPEPVIAETVVEDGTAPSTEGSPAVRPSTEEAIVVPPLEPMGTGAPIDATSTEPETPVPVPALTVTPPETELAASPEPAVSEAIAEDKTVTPILVPGTEKSAEIPPSAEGAILTAPLEPMATATSNDVTKPEPETPVPVVSAASPEMEPSATEPIVAETLVEDGIVAPTSEAAVKAPIGVTSPEAEAPVPVPTLSTAPPETELPAATTPKVAEVAAEDGIVAPTSDDTTAKLVAVLQPPEDAIVPQAIESAATEASPDVTFREPEMAAPAPVVSAASLETEPLASPEPGRTEAVIEDEGVVPTGIEAAATEAPIDVTSPEAEIPAPAPALSAAPSETELPASSEPILAENVAEHGTVSRGIDLTTEKPGPVSPSPADEIIAPATEPAAETSVPISPSTGPATSEEEAESPTTPTGEYEVAPADSSATSTPTVLKDAPRKKRLSLFGKIKKEVKGIFHHHGK